MAVCITQGQAACPQWVMHSSGETCIISKWDERTKTAEVNPPKALSRSVELLTVGMWHGVLAEDRGDFDRGSAGLKLC